MLLKCVPNDSTGASGGPFLGVPGTVHRVVTRETVYRLGQRGQADKNEQNDAHLSLFPADD